MDITAVKLKNRIQSSAAGYTMEDLKACMDNAIGEVAII